MSDTIIAPTVDVLPNQDGTWTVVLTLRPTLVPPAVFCARVWDEQKALQLAEETRAWLRFSDQGPPNSGVKRQ